MAHEVETMAYAGQVPWHGLGVSVINDLTPSQMLKKAGLDWSVDKVPAYVDYNGQKLETGKQALVRSSDNRILTMISEDWEPVQNDTAFEFFNDFVMTGDMEMHTAGSLKQGNMVWALAKVKDSFSLFKGKDTVESYLLFSNPHEYGKSIDIRFTPIRVVCNNTLTLSLNQKSDMMVRLNHRRAFDADMVKNTMGIAKNKLTQYKEMAEFLASKSFKADTVVEYFQTVFPMVTTKLTEEEQKLKMSRPASIAHSVLESQPGAEFGEGTWWSAFNAVTYSIDHLLGRSADTRIQSSWYGINRSKKIQALEKAVDFAEAA